MNDMSIYNIYIEKPVIVLTAVGEQMAGVLTDINNDGVFVDDQLIAASDIADVRYRGTLDLDAYEVERNKLITPERFILGEEELMRLIGADYAFGEKILDYTCHLTCDPVRDALQIADMDCVRIRHAYCPTLLKQAPHLFRVNGGDYIYAAYTEEEEGAYLTTPDQSVPFEPEHITDITPCPAVGKSVSLTLKDGSILSAEVASSGPRGITLVSGHVGRIAYTDITEIRYTGVHNTRMENGIRTHYFDDYPTRLRYFRDRSNVNYKLNAQASFAVGMTSTGYTAKDVVPDKKDHSLTGYGILANYSNLRANGYVGRSFRQYTDLEGKRRTEFNGQYFLRKAVLPKTLGVNDIDTYRYVYAVRFQYEELTYKIEQSCNRIITQIEILEAFPRREYNAVSIDEDGNITVERNENAANEPDPLEEGYGFLFYYSTDKNYGYIAKTYSPNKQETVRNYTVYFQKISPKFDGQLLDTLKYVYMVRYWRDTRQVPARADWSPAVYNIELLSALDRTRPYSLTKDGAIYDHTRFTALNTILFSRVVVVHQNNNRTMGVLSGNDMENCQLTISYNETASTDIPYSDISRVYGLGTVTNYQEDTQNSGFGRISAGSSVYFPESQVMSSKLPKLKVGDLVSFNMEAGYNSKPLTKNVCPLQTVTDIGYVIANAKDGHFTVLDEKQYYTVPRSAAHPQSMPLLDSAVKLSNLDSRDCKVLLTSLYYENGALLIAGIQSLEQSLSKLHFGRIRDVAPDENGKLCGHIAPMDTEETAALYFHQSKNPVLDTVELRADKDLGVVCYTKAHDPDTKEPVAKNMAFVERQLPSHNERTTAPVPPPVEARPNIKIDDAITKCLQQNDMKTARRLLQSYQEQNSLSDFEYNRKLYRILEKEVKLAKEKSPEAASAARREALACIEKVRAGLDRTDQYGSRLTFLLHQADLLALEGKRDEARTRYREWQALLREFTAIYPDKRSNYVTWEQKVLRNLNALDNKNDALVEAENDEAEDPIDEFDGSLADYLDWRVRTASLSGKKTTSLDDLWVKTQAEMLSADSRRQARIAACQAEFTAIRDLDLFKTKAQFFAFLQLALDDSDNPFSETVQGYFRPGKPNDAVTFNALRVNADAVLPTRCNKRSDFTVDSILLFACTPLDRKAFVTAFRDKPILITQYCRELCYLLGKPAQKAYDIEQLNTLFEEAIAFIDPPDLPTDKGEIDKYAAALQDKLAAYQERWGISVPQTIEDTVRALCKFGKLAGFDDRLNRLRASAEHLQNYRAKIQKEPTVYDWGLIWKLCLKLIGQIQRSWQLLCQVSVPEITVGQLRAEALPSGEWEVTVPLRNGKRKAAAEEVTVSVLNTKSLRGSTTLHGDGSAGEYVFRIRPENETVKQITLQLTITYQYINDVDFRRSSRDTKRRGGQSEDNTRYIVLRETKVLTQEHTVSCFAGERPELSTDIIDMLSGNAKKDIDVSTDVGRAVAKILENRTAEVQTILGHLATGAAGSRRVHRNGRWIALYGQWRVGKTTLLYEVLRALRNAEFHDQVIPACASFAAGEKFEKNTVRSVLTDIRLNTRRHSPEQYELWLDCVKEWREAMGEPTTFRDLTELLQQFHEQPNAACIVLGLDEFTQIYEEIKSGHITTAFLRDFLYFVSESGCIVITAGAEHSISLMRDFDINMMQKADLSLEVRYLSREDTATYVETVITEPAYLGNEVQKARTISRIYELTQGNVFLLYSFCGALITYVRSNKKLLLIDDLAIQHTLDALADREGIMSLLFDSLYNPYHEYGNQQPDDGFEHVRDMNLKLLTAIVRNAYRDSRTCVREQLKKEFREEENFDQSLDMLISRSIVRESHDNLSIPIDMYYELQTRIDRKEEPNELS